VLGTPESAGSYALVGMAAMTAATTHAPLMAAVLVFELSGDYAIVLPLILATATATFVSRRLHPDSIYTAELRARRHRG
jgi:CIC family chloride channel protein